MYNVYDSGRQKACENEQLFPIRTCYKWQLCVWMYLYQEVLLPIKWTICRTRFWGPWGYVSFLIKCWEIKSVCGIGPVINICTSRTSQNWLYASPSLPCQSLRWVDAEQTSALKRLRPRCTVNSPWRSLVPTQGSSPDLQYLLNFQIYRCCSH